MKKIIILGSTGSIGTQTLDICEEYPELMKAVVLVARRNTDLLIKQALEFRPQRVVIADPSCSDTVREALKGENIEVCTGAEAIVDAISEVDADIVLTAMVGYSGLAPTLKAIEMGRDIALANKETLVVAGQLIRERLNTSRSRLFPVDSEHSAIYQCLVGERPQSVSKLILTASGGPFRTFTKEQLQYVTKADALNHPNWDMGAKVTIDSAQMMNKGFEIMEARWLFDIEADRIEVAVHPQSIVHSMVEFVDGSIKAQLGVPDMHLPIRYALGLPISDVRLTSNVQRRLSIKDYSQLTFEEPDIDKFPMLGLAYEALRQGGNVPCALNAANEIAVECFLREQIRFVDMPRLVQSAIEHLDYIQVPTLEDYIETDCAIRLRATELAKTLISR